MFMLFVAAALCSIGGVCIKMLPWEPLAINGARGLIAAGITFLYMRATKHKLVLCFSCVASGLSLALTMLFYVLANRLTSAAHAIMLMYTSPVFVILYLWLFKRKKPNLSDGISAALVFCGIALLSFDGLLSGKLFGDFIALLSGIAYAGVFLVNTAKKSDALSAFFLGQLFAGVIGLPSLISQTDYSCNTLIIAGVLGVFQLGISYILMAKGIERTAPVAASIITAAEPVLSPVWVMLFYGEAMSAISILGAVMVVLSVSAKAALGASSDRRAKGGA